MVVRDHDGRFLVGTCHFPPSLPDPEAAELQACKRDADLAVELGLSKAIF